jgi:glycosyltransferase involved in cell wall biosynthesis
MRIGIDCRTILNPKAGNRAGIAHYTYYLVKALLAYDKLDEFVLLLDHSAREIVKEFLEPNSTVLFFSFSQYRKYLPFVYSHLFSALNVRKQKLDVFHSPANVVPLGYRGPFTVTVHDLAIYRHPDLFPSKQGFSVKYLVPKTVDRADRIIAVSESTKKDVQEFFEVPEDKISVVYEGVLSERYETRSKAEISSLRSRFGISGDYLLFVGTLEPRKNLIRLLEAFYLFLERRPDLKDTIQLVITGGKGWLYDSIFEEVESRKLGNRVIFTGYLATEELTSLYTNALASIYPSLYEGFGLPVLEAMSAGLPVITSNTSSMPEVAGSAALLVDPLDTEGLSRSLEKVIDDKDLRSELSRKGRRQAKLFSWQRAAEETLKVYKSIKK